MVNLETITHRVKEALKSILHRSDTESDNIIETDFEHEKHRDKLESRNPGMNSYGTFSDTAELLQFHHIKEELVKALNRSCQRINACCIDISNDQISHIAQDLVRMACTEPCGLRGAVIFVILEQKSLCKKLAMITGDPNTTPTFEVYLTLREDTSRWRVFRKAFLTLKGCLLNSKWNESPIVVCNGFQLEKKRLYRHETVQ
ncbi:hypothetical protein C0Q70_01498 [Pomacea canaliculata]|uniref:DNA damage-inducible transcript 4-like protein n=1 Tax=Pomacea canaliculata TaxID=400727 RepID=A0A2T7PZM0_POMCA|nr:DNA damage-inducible transcript 4-like protein [Pomacea canaliculata]PVD38873.1 hypothetical protein C0Q70_01498 [Pomacea canaliculata]